MTSLAGSVLQAYELTRSTPDSHLLCKAPFNNMYFNIWGQCGPCWLTLDDRDRYPDKSIREIWSGQKFQAIRDAIRSRDLDHACRVCKKNLETGSFVSVLAKLYDLPHALTDQPSEMEFELSNVCNLECVMCKGELSSTIRKHRDELPAIATPYDDAFVEELASDFLPHLKEAKFLGGEPFLIRIYYEIWDRIAAVNPDVEITVTTNGTSLNRRVKSLLEQLRFNLIVSMDSIYKETYERIRIRSSFEEVMQSFLYYRDYTRRKHTYMQLSANPLRRNWRELADYVDFCNVHDVRIWFNTIVYPHDEALWTLDAERLEEIRAYLSSRELAPRTLATRKDVYEQNVSTFRNLVDRQISGWLRDARNRQVEKASLDSETLEWESHERLRRSLREYLETDAYLTQGLRRLREQRYLGKLDRLAEHASEDFGANLIYKGLYLLPLSICVEYLESKSGLDIVETLKRQ